MKDMLAEERHQKIIALLQKDGKIRIEDMRHLFPVTTETLRRDLAFLEKNNILKKVHGGAILSSHGMRETGFRVRYMENLQKKQVIAGLALQFIQEHYTIMLDASSTSFCLAEKLEHQEGIMVITNSLKILDALSHSKAKVIGLGGELDCNAYAFVGVQTLSYLDDLYADISFISCHGFDRHLGLMDISPEEAAIKEKILAHSSKKYLLIDDSKFGKKGAIKIKGIDHIDAIITNKKPVLEWEEYLNSLPGTVCYPPSE